MRATEPATEGRAHAANVSHTKELAGSKHAEAPAQSQSDGQDAPELKSAELELVDRLILQLPPILTRGDDWFTYGDGVWTMRTRAHYRPEALAVQHPEKRTEKMAARVLRHIEGKFQVKESPFCGAYKFDANTILIAVANGMLRIIDPEEGECVLEKYSPDHHFTQKLAVPFDPHARAKTFLKALSENLPTKEDQFLFWMFLASTLIPDCRWEASLCCFGETGTGRSTLFEGIEAMFGKGGPCRSLSLSQLCDHESYNGPDLEFAMLNFSTELSALKLDSDRFKQLVSGERISVRGIYQAPFYIKPTCKYAFLTNHLPQFKHGSGAELRRLRFLKFCNVPLNKDLELKKKVAAEGAGILNLVVRSISELLSLNTMPFGGIKSAETHERFQVANDPVGVFVETECELDLAAYEKKENLEARFVTFLSHHGLREGIAGILFKELYDRFDAVPVRPRKSDGTREHGVNGITLKPITESRL